MSHYCRLANIFAAGTSRSCHRPSACFYETRLASSGKGPEHLPSFIGLEAFRKNRAFRFGCAAGFRRGHARQSLGRHNRRLGQR